MARAYKVFIFEPIFNQIFTETQDKFCNFVYHSFNDDIFQMTTSLDFVESGPYNDFVPLSRNPGSRAAILIQICLSVLRWSPACSCKLSSWTSPEDDQIRWSSALKSISPQEAPQLSPVELDMGVATVVKLLSTLLEVSQTIFYLCSTFLMLSTVSDGIISLAFSPPGLLLFTPTLF